MSIETTILVLPFAIVALVLLGAGVLFGFRRVVNWIDGPDPLPADEDTPLPQYPPAFVPGPEVIVGQIVVTDALGEWCPDEHQPEPARFADAVLAELRWQTIAQPPTWASWSTTGYRQLEPAR